jgi:beta-lactam-binding protein with PASTA domain
MIALDAVLSEDFDRPHSRRACSESWVSVASRIIGAFIALGMLALPITLDGQARPPTTTVTARRILPADSARFATLPQARTIPNVIGMTAMQAVDSLRWTKLPIVQRDSTATQFTAGTVVDQRPRAGTPTFSARAETLFVATAPRKPTRRGPSWADVVGAIVSGVASPTQPPPARTGTDTPPRDVPPREVPTQPGAGSVVVPGTRVQDRTRVPNLREDTPRMVAAVLRRSRLNQGNVSRDYSDEVPSGRVFRQQPPATQEVATNTNVDVWYSIGPHPAVNTLLVPSVVGLTLAEATDSLRRAGLQTGHIDYLVQRGAESKVVHQVPQERQPAHRGDAVDLTITALPSPIAVPSVKGLTRQAAKQKLESVGLGVGSVTLVVRPNTATVIVSQQPAPPATADSGTLVDLVENRPPELRRVTVPDLSGKSIAAAATILRRNSLELGDVLRPAAHAVDLVIDQQPKAGTSAYMHSRVTVALGIDSPLRPSPTVRVPGVVTLTVDSARHVLADSGFTQLSISSHGEALTSTSIVESQTPAAGTFAVPNEQIALVATPFDPLPVPDLVGLSGEAARTATEIDGLSMIAGDTVRRLRLHDEVVSQTPRALSPRPPDSKVNVTIAIPVMPPLTAAILGSAIVVGGGAATIKKWRDRKKRRDDGARPPASEVIFTPVAGRIEAPLLHTDEQGTLIRGSLTLRFGQDADPWTLNVEGNSLVKPEKPPDA